MCPTSKTRRSEACLACAKGTISTFFGASLGHCQCYGRVIRTKHFSEIPNSEKLHVVLSVGIVTEANLTQLFDGLAHSTLYSSDSRSDVVLLNQQQRNLPTTYLLLALLFSVYRYDHATILLPLVRTSLDFELNLFLVLHRCKAVPSSRSY
jgi:hypothetical protein